MTIEVVTEPTWEPVTLDEAKLFARVDINDDDALITALIVAARHEAEVECHRTISQKTMAIKLPRFCTIFNLALPPIISVSSIKYYDTSNDLQTVSTDDYQSYVHKDGGVIMLKEGASWPSSVYDRPDAVIVTYVAGYASASVVPENIKTYIKIMVSTMYDVRESEVVGTITSKTNFVPRLLDKHRLINV